MERRLARRMAHMTASEIREILKLTRKPGVISFAGGLPAPEFFPVDRMKAVAVRILEEGGCDALQYSPTEGDFSLRKKIAGRMKMKFGATVGADEVLITSGSQQGLDLSGKMFLDEGDKILCESPTYLGAIQALRAYGPRFIEVPTDGEGMIVSELEKRLSTGGRIKMIYVNPDFQNPSGRTWSLERRREFMEIVTRHEIPVVEDNPYGELCFEGAPMPSIKSLDPAGLVIFLGTFSKILCPGLRIGWLAATPALVEKYVLVKQGADLHTSTFGQRQVAAYMEMYDLEEDIRRIREAYRKRRDAMARAMEREFPADIHFTRPSGGLFVWVELPEGLDARELLRKCLDRDVAFVPGGSFFPNGGRENTIRFNYSNMPEERIAEGIRRVAEVLRAMPGRETSISVFAGDGGG